MGPQLRQRFNLVSGSTEGHLRQLAPFGLDRNHVDAVFRTEMGHRQYAHKWMDSLVNDMAAQPNSSQEEQEPTMMDRIISTPCHMAKLHGAHEEQESNKDGSDDFNSLQPK
jgi:hypothetical protein